MKKLYDGLKEIYGPTTSGSSPQCRRIFSHRWQRQDPKEMGCTLWKCSHQPSTINDEAINRLPQVPVNEALDAMPTFDEIQQSIRLLSSGKAPGSDSIPAEIYRGWQGTDWETPSILQVVWQHETLPQDFKDACITHLYKRKGNRKACDNHRGISPLSVAGKALARVLLNGLIDQLEQGLLYQRASVAFGRIAGLSTWCLLPCSFKRSVGIEHWPVLHLCRSDQGLWHC